MPAINSRSERGSVHLAELSLLLAAVRGPPNPRSACQKVERSRLESLFHRRGTERVRILLPPAVSLPELVEARFVRHGDQLPLAVSGGNLHAENREPSS